MNSKIFTIVIFLLLAASPARSQDFFVARVLEVNPKNLELLVVSTTGTNSNVTVRVAGENDLPRHDGVSYFPECVVQGATIRLWGSTEGIGKPVFLATDIRGCRKGGCSDPTGVRSRLRKLWNHGNRNSEEGREHFGLEGRGAGGHGNGGGNGNGGGGGGNR